MEIEQWFTNGCDYKTGVALYAALPGAKPNLLQLFKKRKGSSYLSKLKYELSKHKDTKAVFTPLTVATTTAPAPTPKIETPKKVYKSHELNEFPLELHPVFIQQRNDFYKACSLKIELNSITAEVEEEDRALKIALEIDRLFDSIELAWKKLDHYIETKTVLEVKEQTFTDLTPAQLLQTRNNRRSSLTKANNRLKHYLTALENAELPISEKTKLEVRVQKTKTKVAQLETDIN